MVLNYKEILQGVINQYGADMQETIAIEEMSELQKEICKNKRGRDNKECIAEEIADVLICLDQLQMIFDIQQLVDEWKRAKVWRIYKRLLEEAMRKV